MKKFLGVLVIFLLIVRDAALFDKVSVPIIIFSIITTIIASIMTGYYSFKK